MIPQIISGRAKLETKSSWVCSSRISLPHQAFIRLLKRSHSQEGKDIHRHESGTGRLTVRPAVWTSTDGVFQKRANRVSEGIPWREAKGAWHAFADCPSGPRPHPHGEHRTLQDCPCNASGCHCLPTVLRRDCDRQQPVTHQTPSSGRS